ncbi:14317_t:CDS:2 [Cetraspora pellucida]|uniref:14317_t:CDS:1 n=1 Tax=Cetraspora pellucida TaxID=1433469 RepID=A0ACA9KGF4_9GLOM|nr:14317_t:CDS:2 [Cetraspora pellucida]
MPKSPIFENQKPIAEVRYLEDQSQKSSQEKKPETPSVNNNQQDSYKDNIPVKQLDKNKDYYQQECKACANKINRLIKYEQLKLSESNDGEIKPHRTDLCAKCRDEEKCWDYMNYQQKIKYQCGSKEVDAWSLYEKNRLVCQPCRMKKEGGASDKEHLKECDCLEQEAKEHYLLVNDNLKRYQEKLKKCVCEKSEKIRVDSDHFASCEGCQEYIAVARLEAEERVLCGNCLEEKKSGMKPLRRAKFNEYRRLGRL